MDNRLGELDETLLEKGFRYEKMAASSNCRIILDQVMFVYAHEIIAQETATMIGPWFSKLSKSHLRKLFPHCEI